MTNTPTAAPRGRLYVIAAPSGAGKTSLVKALLARRPGIEVSVSYTTRKPRPNEVDGRDYCFVDRAAFERLIAEDALLEHALVFDNFYGTSRARVEGALAAGRDVILEIDWQGARQVRARLPDCATVFILPPSHAALERRLHDRRTDDAAVIARRLRDAAADISHWREFDYVIVNDRFEEALAALERIVARDGAAWVATRPGLEALAAELLG
ncbi:MAG: guanylate kinase [Steroidobacteraceae bacterium]